MANGNRKLPITNGMVRDIARLDREINRLRKKSHDFSQDVQKVVVALAVLKERAKFPFRPAED